MTTPLLTAASLYRQYRLTLSLYRSAEAAGDRNGLPSPVRPGLPQPYPARPTALPLAQSSARGLASVLQEAGTLQREAASLMGAAMQEPSANPNSAAIVSGMRKLVDSYNRLGRRIEAAEGAVSGAIKRAYEGAIRELGPQAAELGVRRAADGSLQMDEAKLREGIGSRYPQVRQELLGPGGLAGELGSLAGRLMNMPAETALERSYRTLRPYILYGSGSGAASQLPWTGLLLNRLF